MRGSGMTYFCGWKLKILLFSDSSSSSTMDLGGKSRRLSYILFSHVQCCLVYSPDEITINDYALPYGTKVEKSEIPPDPSSSPRLLGIDYYWVGVPGGLRPHVSGFGRRVLFVVSE